MPRFALRAAGLGIAGSRAEAMMNNTHPEIPDTVSVLQAAWGLKLPFAQHVLVVGDAPAGLLAWWQRHGVRLTRMDSIGVPRTLLDEVGEPGMVLVWTDNAVEHGTLRGSAAGEATEVVIRTRVANPWQACSLLLQEALRHRGGLHRRERLIAWPEWVRLRQVVPHRDWTRTPIQVHRRSRRWWKDLVYRSPLGVLLAPGWLTRWQRTASAPRPSWLDDILHQASAETAIGLRALDLRLSPNGVAIVRVGRQSDNSDLGILKIPLSEAAEPRVENNARALRWMQSQSGLGSWTASPPQLLAMGATHGASWTLEEHVGGSEAQTWDIDAARQAVQHLATLLQAFHAQAAVHPADDLVRCLQPHVEAIAALLHGDLAQRLQELWQHSVRNLAGARVPRVPQHGDCKLENALGDVQHVRQLRLLDWELWTPDGLPLLDLVHLLLSRHRRDHGVSIGGSICRWLLDGDLEEWEERLLQDQAGLLDARYVAAAPMLYWLQRIGPVAQRGVWPDADWARDNVEQVLERMTRKVAEVVA